MGSNQAQTWIESQGHNISGQKQWHEIEMGTKGGNERQKGYVCKWVKQEGQRVILWRLWMAGMSPCSA